MRPGTVRYEAHIDDETGQIGFSEFVLRSTQSRKKYRGMTWFDGPRLVNYWVQKEKDLTWVKRSRSHGDWGWANSIPEWMRRTVLADAEQPGRPTKKGALMELLASNRSCLKSYGDTDPEFPDELPYTVKIKKIKAALKRAS